MPSLLLLSLLSQRQLLTAAAATDWHESDAPVVNRHNRPSPRPNSPSSFCSCCSSSDDSLELTDCSDAGDCQCQRFHSSTCDCCYCFDSDSCGAACDDADDSVVDFVAHDDYYDSS